MSSSAIERRAGAGANQIGRSEIRLGSLSSAQCDRRSTCNDHTAGDAALFPAGEIILVNFTVNELEHVHGHGKIVVFAGLEIEFEGFVVQTRGWQVVRENGEIAVNLPNFRGKNGRAVPCILLRNETSSSWSAGSALRRWQGLPRRQYPTTRRRLSRVGSARGCHPLRGFSLCQVMRPEAAVARSRAKRLRRVASSRSAAADQRERTVRHKFT